MPAISLDIAAESRDLVHHAVRIENADGSELDANWNRALEEFAHLFGFRCGREIPVEVRVPKQRVADCAADAPGLVAGALEGVCDLSDVPGWVQLHWLWVDGTPKEIILRT